MTRSWHTPRCLAVAVVAAGLGALSSGAAFADPSASASTAPVTTAGTSFLTAVSVQADQEVTVPGSTGDYLYWAFIAKAGDTAGVSITVTLPPTASRHGGSTWSVDVFDGLRRRQACTSGSQSPMAPATATSVELGCTLRQVRSWAEPWSGDPLPGTYFIRLAASDLPEQDLGLSVQVDMLVTAEHSGDPAPEGGELTAPLVPAGKPGKVRASAAASGASPSASEEADSSDWLPDASSRWAWTSGGGVLAAVAGVVGFTLSRRLFRRPAR